MSLRRRQLPALAALTFVLAAGASALGADPGVDQVAHATGDARDGLLIPVRPASGMAKVALRVPAPDLAHVGGRPALAAPTVLHHHAMLGAELHRGTPLYDLLHVYRL